MPFEKEPHHLHQDEVFILMAWDMSFLTEHLSESFSSTWEWVSTKDSLKALMRAGHYEPESDTFWIRLQARNLPGGGYGMASRMAEKFSKKAKHVLYWNKGDLIRNNCIHDQFPAHCSCGELPKVPEHLLDSKALFINYEFGPYNNSMCYLHVIPVSESLSKH